MENEELKAEIYVLREYVKALVLMLPPTVQISNLLAETERTINREAQSKSPDEQKVIEKSLKSLGISRLPLNSFLAGQPG